MAKIFNHNLIKGKKNHAQNNDCAVAMVHKSKPFDGDNSRDQTCPREPLVAITSPETCDLDDNTKFFIRECCSKEKYVHGCHFETEATVTHNMDSTSPSSAGKCWKERVRVVGEFRICPDPSSSPLSFFDQNQWQMAVIEDTRVEETHFVLVCGCLLVVLLIIVVVTVISKRLYAHSFLPSWRTKKYPRGGDQEWTGDRRDPYEKFEERCSQYVPIIVGSAASDYEIPIDELDIDFNTKLGEGEFGLVVTGLYKGHRVAVKSSKPDIDLVYLQALLSELRILHYVGSHPNIVEFWGAVTARMSEGIVYVVMELSPKGDLGSNLKKIREAFHNVGKHGRFQSHHYVNEERVTVKNLLNWCRQIASGMKYLEGKRVIHGDMACRNVLLFDGDVVKITDFGLSRKLYKYETYIKKNLAPVPWRYMPPETLSFMEFSSKSDVWSFGVTTWEIFTLGKIPYSPANWTANFPDALLSGLRLAKPDFASQAVYDTMLSCWEKWPEGRPSFTKLEKFYEKMFQESYSYLNQNF